MTNKQITNITFGYADSEDRLWARLILSDQTEERLWLTRALCQACCNAVSQLLKDTCEILPHETKLFLTPTQKLQLELSLVRESPTDPSPEQPRSNQMVKSPSLCHTIKITPGTYWQILFIGNSCGEFVLLMDRQQVFKFLLGLHEQGQHVARWNLLPQEKWFEEALNHLKSKH